MTVIELLRYARLNLTVTSVINVTGKRSEVFLMTFLKG